MKINEDTKSKFLERFENEIGEVDECRLEIFEEKAKYVSKEVMETKFWKKVIDTDKIEQIWFTNTIKKEISIRRNYNKKKRCAVDAFEKEIYETLYQQQKQKVQNIENEAVNQYEKKNNKLN